MFRSADYLLLVTLAALIASGCRTSAGEPAEGPVDSDYTQDTPAVAASAALRERRDRVREQPADGAAWHALAQSLLDPDLPTAQRHPIEAVRAAHRALDYGGAPEAAVLVTLGTAYYLSGNVSAAIDAYERAILADSDGVIDSRAELEELIRGLREERLGGPD